jgi:phenylacetate-CoA ligase
MKQDESEYHSAMEVRRNNPNERKLILRQDRMTFCVGRSQHVAHCVEHIRKQNAFYESRLSDFNPVQDFEDFAKLPLTRKSDLIGHDDYAANLTFDRDRYCRFHRTSGTTGRPLAVLDTFDDWQWWMEGWQYVLDAAGVKESDCVLMAFSFGPFVGFWSAFDASVERGCLVMPTGAMSTDARLDLIQSSDATVVFCTPSYALHMAQLASTKGIDLSKTKVRKLIVAGEPGGSVPGTRTLIERRWGARVVDHAGATEVGPWGFADSEGTGLFINETLFYPEFLEVESDRLLTQEQASGNVCQLVLTTLGRFGCPVIRYVTGDLVKPVWTKSSPFVFLDGGVIGRSDDMMIIRGVNVYPGSIEQIVRGFPEVDEFQMIAWRDGQMDQLRVTVEDQLNQPARIAAEIQLRLGLRVDVEVAESGSLPRFEMKGKRFIDQR